MRELVIAVMSLLGLSAAGLALAGSAAYWRACRAPDS
jgi:hypothetical protein